MALTHAQARRMVERLNLIGPSHGTVPGDYDRVRAAFEERPRLPAALNALDPGQMEETPQGAAAHLGCREILQCMLARGVRLDPFMACALGWLDPLAAWLRAQPQLANARGAHGIHLLNHTFDRQAIQLLLDHGADPNASVYAPWGWTPMHEAAARGRREVMALLVAGGGKLNPETAGTTPLHAAARMGHRPMAEWLLERGADPRARGRGGPWEEKTPLAVAREYGHDEIAALLTQSAAR